MTTAHRPTWKAAVGQANEGGWTAGGAVSHQRSALSEPAHTKLKFRESKIDRQAAIKQSLLALEEAEKTSITKLGKRPINQQVEERAKQKLLTQTAEIDIERIKKKYDDSDVENSSDESDLDTDDNDSDLESDDSSDDEEDDEAALQAELAKIRAEREQAKKEQQDQEDALDTEKMQEAAITGNPLLNPGKLKRRWNDDVVFRNQAKSEQAPKKRFINDTVRNDFARRFLNKFMR